ncbi:MAG: hypothetical protein RLZZ136_1638 [Pseudomonadota bacterium]
MALAVSHDTLLQALDARACSVTLTPNPALAALVAARAITLGLEA